MCHASRDRGCHTGHVTPLLMSMLLSAPALLAVVEVSRSLVIIKENQKEEETFNDTERISNFYSCIFLLSAQQRPRAWWRSKRGEKTLKLWFSGMSNRGNLNFELKQVSPSFLISLVTMTLVLSRNVWVEMMGGSQEPRPSPGVTGPGHVQPGVRPNTCRLLSQWSTTQVWETPLST